MTEELLAPKQRPLKNCAQCKSNVDGAGCDTYVYNTPLSQDALRSRSVGRNSTNCCWSICCPRTETWLLSVNGLNECCYAVCHHPEPEESGVYAIINRKTDKAKSFPYMSEHSSLFYLKLEHECEAFWEEIWIWTMAPKAWSYFLLKCSRCN